MTEQDMSLPHQIQLVFASGFTTCLNGDKVLKADVVVTCNCHRIGQTPGFREYMGAAPTLVEAWKHYNTAGLHYRPQTFNEREG